MFVRSKVRSKGQRLHRYFSVVENRRVQPGKVVQRTVLSLPEINDSEQADRWKTVEVFDEAGRRHRTVCLFPADRPLPVGVRQGLQAKLSQARLGRPRAYGACWLACELWRELGLDRFWRQALPPGREEVAWEKVLRLLVVNRVLEPRSEFHVHREWFDHTAIKELLDVDAAAAGKDRLYRCLDRILKHRQSLFARLKRDLQDESASFELLLYGPADAYFVGERGQVGDEWQGGKHDSLPDCRRPIIALLVTSNGFPFACEVIRTDSRGRGTLREVIQRIESIHGRAERVWVMDPADPREETLIQMRAAEPRILYLVGATPNRSDEWEKKLLEARWRKLHGSIRVKVLTENLERFILIRSEGPSAMQVANRRSKLARLLHELRKLRRNAPPREHLMAQLREAGSEAGDAFRFVEIVLPAKDRALPSKAFHFRVKRDKLWQSELRRGYYLLRSNFAHDAEVVSERSVQLSRIAFAFQSLKDDPAIPPIYHRRERRAEAHILVAFLAYCLLAHLDSRLRASAPGLTIKAGLEKLASIRMIDVWLPTIDGRWLILPRYTQPEPALTLLLQNLQFRLPNQPTPRICNVTPGAQPDL